MEDFDLNEWLSTHSDASLLEKLRQAGVSNAYGVKLIHTVRGVGYVFRDA